MKDSISFILWLLTIGFILLKTTNAVVVHNFSDIQGIDFDFIIIGGGTSGSVIANRLSENRKFQILVLEAGPSNVGVLASDVPWFAPQLWGTTFDWNYTTVPQPTLAGRSISMPRGHLLGGTSSINFMLYTRGSEDEYDDYARLLRDDGWSWKNLQRYFRKSEKWTPPADNHNTTGQFNPAFHSFNGMNSVSLSGFPTPIDGRIIHTTKQLSDDFPFIMDYNGGNPLGLGWTQNTIKGAHRSSSATSYMNGAIARPNIYVMNNATVSRILKTSNGKVPQFRGVEFKLSSSHSLIHLKARKEIILSAGVIGSPHVLLHSGIGDSDALSAVGVTPVVHLPEVGQNFADHFATQLTWLVNGNDTFEKFNDPVVAGQLLDQWKNNGTGPFVNSLFSHLAIFRAPPSVSEGSLAVGETTPHYEFLLSNGLVIPSPLIPSDGHFFTIVAGLMSPKSKGSIRLGSNNPFDAPLIDPRYMSEDVDRRILREAVKQAFKFVSAPAWSDYIIGPTGGLENVTTDDEIDDYITHNAGTFFHPTSSNRMTYKGATAGVVDPDFKLKKVDGVRIIDASILPYIISCHPQAAIYAFSERAADIIKSSYS